eukprot:gnl/TRDRNA2_/TRDRNA2_189056_c0_seq1.p1 gnl/TRDRNA2_/TRDRNA2_189056_c0~~gnl/TRDRNA2_/TRDRNA2_189056_c0_seq1.p1  ORF type:complete len:706 (+),score=177.13 gnl/TRDRNA2_/TRDRNA2_189056_c0_seq1:102-2219(+)
MQNMFRGEGCAVNEAGISSAGNPLGRMFDAVNEGRHMREGFGPGRGKGGGPLGMGGQMLGPMQGRPGGSLDAAWDDAQGPGMAMRRPSAGMPVGLAMQDQLNGHMRARGPGGPEAGFFAGPMGGPQLGDDWASEFGHGPQMMRPHGPPGGDWAAEFAGPRPMPGGGPPPAHMEAAFHQAQMSAAFHQAQMQPAVVDQARMEAAFRQAPAAPAAFQQMEASFQQAAPAEQAAQMVDMLRTHGNPKLANPQLVNFIDQVSRGDLQFKDDTVVDRNGKEVDWDKLYDASAATASDAESKELGNLWEASARNSSLENAWASADEGKNFEDLWQAAGQSELEALWGGKDADREALAEAWRMAGTEEDAFLEQAWSGEDLTQLEQMWQGAAAHNAEYEFSKDNPYLGAADPLAQARQLLSEGRDREALLALEAEVQKNPESSEGWRMLGQLYAELDQDVEAIRCLRRGHEVDPYNLESLLALGVSCTNELDQLPALKYLREWIENHEEHQVLVNGLEMPPQYEYEAWRQQVTMLFNNAAMANPLDADVFVALGVMENINRNYDKAIAALANACRLRPNDHTVWNKLGATLANSGKSEQAVVAYHQGLQLKPNYARSWSNLAIAHANLGQHQDAARFYLSSLVLNPDAVHIWNFLYSAVLNMGTTDAFGPIERRDLEACSKIIEGVLDPAALPRPRQELSQPPDEVLRSIDL